MKQLVTTGIVLSRTNYGEADRIITLLTPEQGKLRLMVRGARRPKSKLAGGIELFSVSDITYINGRGDIGTLISSRLKTHYGRIVKDLTRVQLGYDLLKQLNRCTEDQPEGEYYDLLGQGLQALDDPMVSTDLIRLWFHAQLVSLAGHAPNLAQDAAGSRLSEDQSYNFDYDAMAFAPHTAGRFKSSQIKSLRLLFGNHGPDKLQQVSGLTETLEDLTPLVRTVLTTYIRV